NRFLPPSMEMVWILHVGQLMVAHYPLPDL
ncbi:hypothetical protein DOY81_010987, partial [Sarcophaga bullata]